jgi:hypothetical protein
MFFMFIDFEQMPIRGQDDTRFTVVTGFHRSAPVLGRSNLKNTTQW